MNKNVIKVIGLAASVVGICATLIGNWASDKKQDEVIAEKVAEAIAKAKKES